MGNDDVFNVQELPFGDTESLEHDDHDYNDDRACDYVEDCKYSCATISDFFKLTDDMINDIISLEEELVRWRQVLIKYLPKKWAEGLRQDILSNMSRSYDGDPAYDLYVQARGFDPQQSWEHAEYMQRLADGTDETSITYL